MNKHNLFIFNSKEIFIFIFKLLFIFVMVLLFCLHISPQFSGNYQASLIDKVENLKNVDGPKIVLLSNSNLVFGINSEEIESKFGMPVINMGLHGGLGNAFHEEMGKVNVCEGDIYIICHNSYSDDGTIMDIDLAWITLENHPELWKLLQAKDFKRMIEGYPAYLKKCIYLWLNHSGNQDSGSVYSRSAFNDYGDIEWEDNGLEYIFDEKSVPVPEITDNVAIRINELNRYMLERGATLLIAGYPIGSGEYTPDKELFIEFQNELKEKMDAPVISDYINYFFDYQYFYDTNLHLNNKGREMRTQQLISDLENYFKMINNAKK